MAFNPSPQVAAARDFAKQFGKDIVIICHVQESPEGIEVGYASYGKDPARCNLGKKLGDIAYDAILKGLT